MSRYKPVAEMDETEHRIFNLRKKLYVNKKRQEDSRWDQKKSDAQNDKNKQRRKDDQEWKDKQNLYAREHYHKTKSEISAETRDKINKRWRESYAKRKLKNAL